MTDEASHIFDFKEEKALDSNHLENSSIERTRTSSELTTSNTSSHMISPEEQPVTKEAIKTLSSAAEINSYKLFLPPSKEEEEMVNKLLVRCKEESIKYNFSSTSALRFLRDKKRNAVEAFAAMKAHAIWRLTNDVENISEAMVLHELEKKLVLRFGRDKKNRPILYVLIRHHDKNNRDIESMKKMIIFSLESALREADPDEERLTIVLDFTDFSILRNMDYEMVRAAVGILQANYPETMNTALVCNAPFVFNTCYVIIKPWLDPVTAAKVQFIKGNELNRFIEHDSIPRDTLGFRV